MKKLLPFVLLFTLVVVLVACKNGDSDQTTDNSAQTLFPGISSTTAATDASADPAVQNVANTYVLTTNPEMQMPSVPTTRFDVLNESVADPYTTQALSTDINFTVPNMTAPVVNSSSLPTTSQIATTASGGSSDNRDVSGNTENTTASKTNSFVTTTNPLANAKAVRVEKNDVAFSGNKVIITIAGGDYKSNSTVISIEIAGDYYDNIPCRISAGNLDGLGNQQITIDLSTISADLHEGATVSGTIPAGFLRSKDGKTYNTSFGFSAHY